MSSLEEIIESYRPVIENILSDYLPRVFDKESMNRYFTEPGYVYDVEGATKSLLDPVWDLLDRGGKRWRPIFCVLLAEVLGGSIDTVAPVAYLCEIVHNGSLVIDDIEDDSMMRRGKDCVHLIYGNDVAINAGCFMYFAPLVVLKEMNGRVSSEALIKAYELYSEEMIKIHLGQGLDIWWHRGNSDPTIEQYLQMCAYKTGTLARLSARLATLFSGGSNEQLVLFGKFAETLGVAFQIQDDILNIDGEVFASKIQQMGEDIYEGKRSLMVLHCIKNASPEAAARLIDILNMHTRENDLIQEAINIIKSTKSIQYARETAEEMVRATWAEVSPLLPENEAKQKLKVFVDYLVDRDM
eukprot:TRINITY_DN6722_c0_g1_i1.p1 TRINITY_DN6722_c0_g1~~TRINITY_DN6722_c0_g1_i1.p1  ORF type:complete len:355 (-),score=96.89 TRINITY_DN6722_c0_g1_i1:1018-2082(-)